MKIDFSGQVALVTGAAGGIGRAVAWALGQVGAKVLLVDIAKDAGLHTQSLIKDVGGEAMFVQADVSDPEQVQNYVNTAMQTWGRIDIFMNNAAWQGEIHSLVDYPLDVFEKVMNINVRGVFLGLKYVLPIMIQQGKGAVVNTASLGSFLATRKLGPYTASKHAVMGLTKTAALEVAREQVQNGAQLGLSSAPGGEYPGRFPAAERRAAEIRSQLSAMMNQPVTDVSASILAW